LKNEFLQIENTKRCPHYIAYLNRMLPSFMQDDEYRVRLSVTQIREYTYISVDGNVLQPQT